MRTTYGFGLALAVALAGTVPALAQDKPTLVFVVNGASDFWKIAEAGVNKAQQELPDYDLQFKYPEQAAAATTSRIAGADRYATAVAISKRHFPNLSPATIRNAMADLEELGYLVQPHTSAGRVPTDKAYRYYVDSFPPASPVAPVSGATLPARRRSSIDGFMERTSSHLSDTTRLTGLLLAPPLKHTMIARVDLMPLPDDRALAVVATDSGWITVREITLDPPVTADEVRALGRELTRRFRDRSVEEIVEMEAAPADPLDALHTRARSVTEQILAMLRGRTLYVSGAINMLDHPEFWDIEATRELLRTFEQKEKLAELMTVLAGDAGVRVTIGDENPVTAMRECTLITSTYMYRDQVLGILGVVGPRRLPYPEVIAIVNETAQHVTGSYRFEVLEGVGHFIPEEVPDELSRLLLEHLAA